jgi:hypothetical protein
MSHSARWLHRATVVCSAWAAIVASGLVAVQPAVSAPGPLADKRVLSMTFNDVVFKGTSTRFINAGTATLSISVASLSGGTIRERTGRLSPATNKAVRMPGFNPDATGPRAVIRVVDRTGPDNLNPGTGAFIFGADFMRDATSESAGSSDNGDNLIQRGLFGGASQYKIQIDHGEVSCRIKGTQGIVDVISPVAISAGRWYRVRCSRSGTTVSLAVSRWTAAGVSVTTNTSSTGPTGSLTPPTSTVPLSIGGKLRANGSVLETTDQFNGRIDNTILQIP